MLLAGAGPSPAAAVHSFVDPREGHLILRLHLVVLTQLLVMLGQRPFRRIMLPRAIRAQVDVGRARHLPQLIGRRAQIRRREVQSFRWNAAIWFPELVDACDSCVGWPLVLLVNDFPLDLWLAAQVIHREGSRYEPFRGGLYPLLIVGDGACGLIDRNLPVSGRREPLLGFA